MLTTPPLPLILPAMPALPVLETEWYEIDGPEYARPMPGRCGYYDLRPRDGSPVERRWFNSQSGNWMCIGGFKVWEHYDAWRGCLTPRELPQPAELRDMPADVPRETRWLALQGVMPELPTLEERAAAERAAPLLIELPGLGDGLKYFDPATGQTWTGKGRMPKWFAAMPMGARVRIEVKRIKKHYYNVATGEQVAYVRGAK